MSLRALLPGVALAAALAAPAADPAALPDDDPVFLAGVAALQDGFYDTARRQFEAYIAKAWSRTKQAQGSVYLLRALDGLGRPEAMVEWVRQHSTLARGTPAEGGVAYWHARALSRLDRPGEALDLLRDVEAKYPRDPYLTAALRLRGHALLQAGQKDRALIEFQSFDEQYADLPENAENLRDWCALLMQEGRPGEAEPVLRRLVQQHPATPAAAQGGVWLGTLLRDRGAVAEAAAAFRAVADHPQAAPEFRAEAWYAVADLALRATNRTEALAALAAGEGLAETPARKIEGRVRRAGVLADAGRGAEALALLESALKEFAGAPGLEAAQFLMAEIHRRERRFAAALQEYQHYLEAFTNRVPGALAGKSECLYELKRFDEAAAGYVRVQALAPAPVVRARAVRMEAQARFAAGQFEPALAAYERALAAPLPAAERAEAAFMRAECLSRLGRRDDALAALRALAADGGAAPAAEQALIRAAELEDEAGRPGAAAGELDAFLLRYPKSTNLVHVLHARAMALYRKGDPRAALEAFDAIAARADAGEWRDRARYMTLRCLNLLGEPQEAMKRAGQFLQERRDSPWAPDVGFWLAEQQYNRGLFAEAETAFLQVARDHPDAPVAPEALFWAGRAAAAQHDYARATGHYNELLKLSTNSPRIAEARFAQGEALSEMGEFSAAILAFDQVIRGFPGAEIADRAMGRRGDCQFTLGEKTPARFQEAIASYRALVDEPRVSADLRLQAEYKLGRCYEKTGRPAEAVERYLNAVYLWIAETRAGRERDDVWFVRAAFQAAALKEAQGLTAEARTLYQRVIETGLPAAEEARKNLEKLGPGDAGRKAEGVP